MILLEAITSSLNEEICDKHCTAFPPRFSLRRGMQVDALTMPVVIRPVWWFRGEMSLEPPPVPPSLPPLPQVTDAPIEMTSQSGPGPRFATGGLLLAILLIIASVGLALRKNADSGHEGALSSDPAVSPNPAVELGVRYAYGARSMLEATNQWNDTVKGELEKSLAPIAKQPADRFRVEIVRAWLHGRTVDDAALQKIETEAPWLKRDREVLRAIETDVNTVKPEDWTSFKKRHGWIARLAHAQYSPADSPERTELSSEGIRTMVVLVVSVVAMGVALCSGLALLVYFIVRYRKGLIQPAAPRPAPAWGGVYVEGFALYIAGWTLLPLALRTYVPNMPIWLPVLLAAGVVPLAMWWPRLRGVPRTLWRETLGMHSGKGFFREMGLGVLGWLAATPFIALCMWIAQLIMKYSNTEMTHPIIEPLTQPGGGQIAAVLLAVVWAPLAEEVTFRGLLLPGLSAWLRWIVGAVVAAFIFAVIHPQGWVAVPAIMSIALAASALRIVRGSLVPSMTLHALNNGALVTLLILAAS